MLIILPLYCKHPIKKKKATPPNKTIDTGCDCCPEPVSYSREKGQRWHQGAAASLPSHGAKWTAPLEDHHKVAFLYDPPRGHSIWRQPGRCCNAEMHYGAVISRQWSYFPKAQWHLWSWIIPPISLAYSCSTRLEGVKGFSLLPFSWSQKVVSSIPQAGSPPLHVPQTS